MPAFLAPVSYAGGVEAPRVADVNGDGRADVVVIDRDGGTVSVFLGNGDGTLRAAQTSAAGTAPSSFTVGDFNGDGRLDVVTANQRDLSLLLGRGDGSFLAPRSLSLPKVGRDAQDPRSVAAGDLDGDGQLDLVVVGQTHHTGSSFSPPGPSYVNVLMGRGGGSFRARGTTSLGQVGDGSVALGDFNGDGKLDVLVAYRVLLGNGDGTLRAPAAVANLGAVAAPVVADLNGDGKLDLVTTNHLAGTVLVLFGNGDGTFQAPLALDPGSPPAGVAVADFNGDGKPDLATADIDGSSVSVLPGNGDGTFQAAQIFSAGQYPGGVAAGDLNGDGFPDLVVTGGGSVSVLLNDRRW